MCKSRDDFAMDEIFGAKRIEKWTDDKDFLKLDEKYTRRYHKIPVNALRSPNFVSMAAKSLALRFDTRFYFFSEERREKNVNL